MRIEWFFIWYNLNPHHPRMLCAKFAWNWPSGSGEEHFFKISLMYFRYFIIISPWKRWGPSFEQTWFPFTEGCIVPSFVEIGQVVLEKNIFKFCQCIFCYFIIISPSKKARPFIWVNLSSITQGCFVPSLVKISSVVLEKEF